MVNFKLYAEFISIIIVSVASLLLRWKASFSLLPLLLPAYASCAMALVLNGYIKTNYQIVIVLFFSLLAIVFSLLLVVQIGLVLGYQGSIPFDPSVVCEIAYNDEEWLLITMLLLAILVAIIEVIRVVRACTRPTKRGKTSEAACSCCPLMDESIS